MYSSLMEDRGATLAQVGQVLVWCEWVSRQAGRRSSGACPYATRIDPPPTSKPNIGAL
jgi:hypothetical protein